VKVGKWSWENSVQNYFLLEGLGKSMALKLYIIGQDFTLALEIICDDDGELIRLMKYPAPPV
jgi:hypothetical protein